MEINLNYEVSRDEFEDLEESFDSVEFIVKETIDTFHFEQVKVDTDDLLTETFEEWLEPKLQAGMRLEMKEDKYILTL